MRSFHWSPGNRVFAILLLGAASLAAAVGRPAPDLGPEPRWSAFTARVASDTGPDAALVATSSTPALQAVALGIVARDPFREDRARARGRHHAPGRPDAAAAGGPAAEAPGAAPPPPSSPPIPQFRVVGLVAFGGGRGLAALELPGAPSRVVNVGEVIADFRLISVSDTEARLRGRDTTLVLSPSTAP